ncbi:MAG: hypothetical protein GY816_19085 [Cytophagales bacterium]|nr:hypothetical protein [Cytophagales bacterium]
MKNTTTFLSQVADQLLAKHVGHLGECTVIFPNKRAGLFLKKHLSKKIDQPVWSPEVSSLEDFLFRFSDTQKQDPLSLIFKLFEAYSKHQSNSEGFEAFYFWGEMLLRDFEEVDHYLVNPEHLFRHIKSDKQLAEDFYFLDPEQEKIIQRFWQKFFPTTTKSQQQFVDTWRILAPVYESFKEQLKTEGVGYSSSIYRELAEQIDDLKLNLQGSIIFAGFNALTPVEEKLIKHFVSEHGAEMIWDVDAYYLDDVNQEAGRFLRKYQKDAILGKTFPSEVERRITPDKNVSAIGVALEVGQVKLVGERIDELLSTGTQPEKIVVVLPQEYMLFPLLNALPESVEKLNVTMGYPLKDTPLFGLLEAAIEVQEHAQMTSEQEYTYYHKPTLDVLSHPYLYQNNIEELERLIQEIKSKNQIRVMRPAILEVDSTVLHTLFRPLDPGENIAHYLKGIVELLGQEVSERFGLEREYLYYFQQMLSRLSEILDQQFVEVDLKTFKSLFRKTARSIKMPFGGEPVEGLQIMGVLETRNLDFKHVFMLNTNEDIFPTTQRNGSFVPYRIRKAFDLPTFEVQDAIFAYLFYGLFQRSEQLQFYYNMYADFGMSGEISRFIHQIEQESGIKIKHQKLSNSIGVRESQPIIVQKTADIIDKLLFRYAGDFSGRGKSKLSASALNVYFRCRLQFYFRYVLEHFSEDQLNDELDAREFGNVLHNSMEILYRDVIENRPDKQVQETDFFQLRSSVDGAIEKAFKKHFNIKDKRKFELKGRNVMIAEVIKKYVLRILDQDEKYAPFQIVGMEKDENYMRTLQVQTQGRTIDVRLGADIDRVDRKDGVVRVIDYKSGRDKREIESIEKLFDRKSGTTYKPGRNKAGFQIMYYAWLYASKFGKKEAIAPGLIGIRELFQADFDFRLTFKDEPMLDARTYIPDFEERFTSLVHEVFDIEQPFDQTEEDIVCKYCDFNGICGRG